MTPKRFILASIVFSSALFFACSKPQEVAPSAVPLFEDLGTYHRAVTTSNEMAQKYFDQGLRLIYGFNHDEAERAFREAIRLDPNVAMAWWGVAYALGPNYNLPMNPERNQHAIEAVQKAQSLQSQAKDTERGLIEAIATRYSADPKSDRVQLDHNYSVAMKELHERFPEDNDIAVLYAESLMDLKPWQLWTHDGKAQPGTTEIVSLLESVLARDPNHPGANHYYIHAIEASPNAEKGQASAARLKTLVPGAGHLVHMPAHIFIRTGDYRGAMEANANAAKADEAYFGKSKPDGVYPMMYYTHNFQFLSTAAGMIGQSSQAMDSALKAVSVVAPMIGHEPAVEYVLPWPLYAMARNEKWNEILGFPRPSDSTASTLAFWFYARSLAHAAKGDMNEAKKARADLDSAKAKVPADFMLNTNKAQDLLSIASLVVDARLAAMAGNRNAAIAAWKKAVEVQDSLIYDEPPAWYYPVRESLGGEYLRAKQFKEAESVFRRDLEINPNNPRSLFGLREALRGQSRNAEAEQAGSAFDKAWQNAELQISVDKL